MIDGIPAPGPSIFTKRTSNWILYDTIYVRIILGYQFFVDVRILLIRPNIWY